MKSLVSDDMEKAADEYASHHPYMISDVFGNTHDDYDKPNADFLAGANWQKEYIIKRLYNHANIDKMVEKFEDKYKPKKVLDTECYKRGIFDTIKTIKED